MKKKISFMLLVSLTVFIGHIGCSTGGNEEKEMPSSDNSSALPVSPLNTRPIAHAGVDQNVSTETLVNLDGRESFDPENHIITYKWETLSIPEPSLSTLETPETVISTFVPDIPGEYIFSLIVSDGDLESKEDNVIIKAYNPNTPPTAKAGTDQSIITGKNVFLDGSGSFDPEGNDLTFNWQFFSLPDKSNSNLKEALTHTPYFTPDQNGEYIIQLTVNDSTLNSSPDQVTIIAATPNAPPVANAGEDFSISVNDTIYLDGTNSSDPDGDDLTYQWNIISKPLQSETDLDNTTFPKPTILADQAGDFVFRLTVLDGEKESNEDTLIVTSINEPPIADPGGPYKGIAGRAVLFDGSKSIDPNGDTLTYLWNFGDKTTETGIFPTHSYKKAGKFPIKLIISDGRSDSTSAQTTASIIAPEIIPPIPTITGIGHQADARSPVIIIQGTNFDTTNPGNNKIEINGKSAIIIAVTKETITAIIPPQTGTGPIKVKTSGGEATSTLDFKSLLSENFKIEANKNKSSLFPDGNTTYKISIKTVCPCTEDNFSREVKLNTENLPKGLSYRFSPPSITAGQTSTITIESTPDVSVGLLNFSITGTSHIDGYDIIRSIELTIDILKKGQTALQGHILNTEGEPLPGVGLKIGSKTTFSDENGNFLILDPPVGEQVLVMDGGPASTEEYHYPFIPMTLTIKEGIYNELPYTPHLHKQKDSNFIQIDTEDEKIVNSPNIPDFELLIPAGAEIIGIDGKKNTKVSISKIPADRLPIKPLPKGLKAKSVYMFYFGKQGGGLPSTPIPVAIPNDLGMLPGEKGKLWYFNESTEPGEAPNDWSIAGSVTVSPDGKTISTDPGVGIPKFCCGAITFIPDEATAEDIPPLTDRCEGGDPVDLSTGTFIYRHTDLILPGIIPIEITRTYRSKDTFKGPFGISTYFSYNWYLIKTGKLVTLVTPPGVRIPFNRQADGSYTNTDEPSYSGSRINYNLDGTSTLRMKDGMTRTFEKNGLSISQKDNNGNKVTFSRNQYYEITKIIDTTGREVKIEIEQHKRDLISRITDPIGREVTYSYDYTYGRGLLKSVNDLNGGITQFFYDSEQRMTSIIDPLGNTEVTNRYDVNNRVCEQEHGDHGIFRFYYITYDNATIPKSMKQLSEAESGGPITEPVCNAEESKSPVVYTIKVDPNNNYTTYRFNTSGRLISTTNAKGQKSYIKRETGKNRISFRQDSLGRRTTYTYDKKGNTKSITDTDGNTTYYTFEPVFNRMTEITDPIGNIYQFEYDLKGNLTKTIDPAENETNFIYNPKGQIITEIGPMGNAANFEYDQNGNIKTITDPLGNKTIRTYDELSRLITETNPLGSTVKYSYNNLNQVIETIGPENNKTVKKYDLKGNLLSLTDPANNITTFTYNTRHKLTSLTGPAGEQETYSYDKNDNILTFTDRKGQTTTYTYNQLNKVILKTYEDNSYTKYDYDTAGRLITVYDSLSGAIEYTYTNFGSCSTCGAGSTQDKIKREITPLGTIEYTYDPLGRKKSTILNGQRPIEYTYGKNNRLTAINHPLFGETIISNNKELIRSSITLPNGVTANYSYDKANGLIGINYSNKNKQIENITYKKDPTGNIKNYQKDSPHVMLPEPLKALYDKSNRMIELNNKKFTYDENGSLTSVTDDTGITIYTWDARNRLTNIEGPELLASFEYDGLNRRIKKTINGRTIQYVYEGSEIIQEIENGVITVEYLRTLKTDEVLGRSSMAGQTYYLSDGLGSIFALTNKEGNIINTYEYNPFGNTIMSGETKDNPFQYTGRENDETGLYYYRSRYYSPELRRFISKDPIGFAGGINFYAYVDNNPVNFADPSGLLTLSGNIGGGWFSGGYNFGLSVDLSTGQISTTSGFGVGNGFGGSITLNPGNMTTGISTTFNASGGNGIFGIAGSLGLDGQGNEIISGGVGWGVGFGASWTINQTICWFNCSPPPKGQCNK